MNRQKINWIKFFAILGVYFLLVVCGRSTRNGAISARLTWLTPVDSSVAASKIPSGVNQVTLSLLNSDSSPVLNSSGAAIQMTIGSTEQIAALEDIPAGSSYQLVANGLNSSGLAIYTKTISDIRVVSGSTTKLGVLEMDQVSGTSTSTDTSSGSGSSGGDTSTPTETSYDAAGDGTSESPFQIGNSEQFIDYMTNGCSSSAVDKCDDFLTITADLDFNGLTAIPISDYLDSLDTTAKYEGTIDGGGFTLSNINLLFTSQNGTALVRHLGTSGVIRNINFSSITVQGVNNSAVLVGACEGTIENITISNSQVTASNNVGGLVGIGLTGCAISNATAGVTVSGTSENVGGLVGSMTGGSIIDSSATGNVTATSSRVGGLVGQVTGTVSITKSKASGTVSGPNKVGGLLGTVVSGATISQVAATGSVTVASGTGSALIGGGLIGTLEDVAISECSASGGVSGTGLFLTESESGQGGLVGTLSGSASITNCFATGSITHNSTNGNAPGGGLVGHMFAGTISRSYATGSVSGVSKSGGLVGNFAGSTFSSSFWDTQTSSQSNAYDGSGGSVSGGNGSDTSTLQTESTFTSAGWDFTNTWQISNGAYPTLRNSPL